MERSFPHLNGDPLFVRICRELELWVAFVRSLPTQGKALALAVDPRPRPGVAQRAAIFCCYGHPDCLALNGRSYEEEDAYRLEKERAS